MGYGGILEDHKMAHVPATVVLDEVNHATDSITQNLKHGSGRSVHIVLAPQPSEDPNDPLNWSRFKKLTVTLILCFGGIMCASVISGILNPGIVVIAADNKRPLTDIVLLSGYQLLVAGSTGAFVNAFARKYGKRPVFLVSSLCGTIGSIIGSATHNYEGLLAARIVQGGSTAAYESLMVSMIGDLYFVHERGLYMAVVQFVLGCVSNFVGIVAGPITTNLGWRYLFHLCSVFCGVQTILLFLFCPETQYRRDVRLETDESVDDEPDVVAKLGSEGDTAHHVERTSEVSEAVGQPEKPPTLTTTRQSQIPLKKTFVQTCYLHGHLCQREFVSALHRSLHGLHQSGCLVGHGGYRHHHRYVCRTGHCSRPALLPATVLAHSYRNWQSLPRTFHRRCRGHCLAGRDL